MKKGDWQKNIEKQYGNTPMAQSFRRIITKKSEHSPCEVGEIVNVIRYGTFGCWDDKNRWVDFYCSEPV
jgi:hypothetical protein